MERAPLIMQLFDTSSHSRLYYCCRSWHQTCCRDTIHVVQMKRFCSRSSLSLKQNNRILEVQVIVFPVVSNGCLYVCLCVVKSIQKLKFEHQKNELDKTSTACGCGAVKVQHLPSDCSEVKVRCSSTWVNVLVLLFVPRCCCVSLGTPPSWITLNTTVPPLPKPTSRVRRCTRHQG